MVIKDKNFPKPILKIGKLKNEKGDITRSSYNLTQVSYNFDWDAYYSYLKEVNENKKTQETKNYINFLKKLKDLCDYMNPYIQLRRLHVNKLYPEVQKILDAIKISGELYHIDLPKEKVYKTLDALWDVYFTNLYFHYPNNRLFKWSIYEYENIEIPVYKIQYGKSTKEQYKEMFEDIIKLFPDIISNLIVFLYIPRNPSSRYQWTPDDPGPLR